MPKIQSQIIIVSSGNDTVHSTVIDLYFIGKPLICVINPQFIN